MSKLQYLFFFWCVNWLDIQLRLKLASEEQEKEKHPKAAQNKTKHLKPPWKNIFLETQFMDERKKLKQFL